MVGRLRGDHPSDAGQAGGRSGTPRPRWLRAPGRSGIRAGEKQTAECKDFVGHHAAILDLLCKAEI